MDVTTCDTDGKAWDFSKMDLRRRAYKVIIAENPRVLIGSVMCRDFSIMMNINWPRMSMHERERRLREARSHLEFVVSLYRLQHRRGHFYIHEHPQAASSWKEPCILDLETATGGFKLTIDQCQYGLKSLNDDGEVLPARKATTFLTKCPGMAKTLNRRCQGDYKCERHTQLEGKSRRREVQTYPEELCRAFVKGILIQKEMDAQGLGLLMKNDCEGFLGQLGLATFQEANGQGGGKHHVWRIPKEEDGNEHLKQEVAWDDVSGVDLDPQKVTQARKDEVEFYRKMGVYVKVPVSECYEVTGKQPASVRWIDHNKGDKERPNYRSRFVGQDYRDGKGEEMCSATPPLGGTTYGNIACSYKRRRETTIDC